MRWYELRSQHLSDEEYVERVRKNLRMMDRYRPWLIAIYIGLFIVMGTFAVPIMVKSIEFMIANSASAPWTVVSGFASGIGLGFVFMSIIYMPLMAMLLCFMPLRTDRLLLQYYDAHQQDETSPMTSAATGERLPSTPL